MSHFNYFTCSTSKLDFHEVAERLEKIWKKYHIKFDEYASNLQGKHEIVNGENLKKIEQNISRWKAINLSCYWDWNKENAYGEVEFKIFQTKEGIHVVYAESSGGFFARDKQQTNFFEFVFDLMKDLEMQIGIFDEEPSSGDLFIPASEERLKSMLIKLANFPKTRDYFAIISKHLMSPEKAQGIIPNHGKVETVSDFLLFNFFT